WSLLYERGVWPVSEDVVQRQVRYVAAAHDATVARNRRDLPSRPDVSERLLCEVAEQRGGMLALVHARPHSPRRRNHGLKRRPPARLVWVALPVLVAAETAGVYLDRQ